MSTITVNTTDLEIIRARQELAGLYGSLDAKRPTAWRQYGYKEALTFEDFFAAYERGGAGHGAVHRILDGCWQALPRIKNPGADKPDEYEIALGEMLAGINAWAKLMDFDRRNLVGRYSAVIYRIADGKKLNEPLGMGKLVDLIPVYENQIKVLKWNEDENSDDYGKPEMFQIETSPPNEGYTEARPRTWLKVHPSRIQILAEGSVNGDFYNGVPLLKAGFNSLVDLEKISGGGGEGFLKNAARNLTIEYDPTSQPSNLGADGETVTVKQAHEDQVRRINSSIDSVIVTQGAKAGVLQTSMPDPTKPFEVSANLFATSIRLPFTVVFGKQTGVLASAEDNKDANKRYKARQQFLLTPMLTEWVNRMQACGAFEKRKFVIEWPDIAAPTDGERLDSAAKMETINGTAFNAGQGEVFKVDEVRKTAGYEPLDEPIMSEGDPGKDPTGDPATDPKADPKAATKTPQG